jgi:hypothetical protein
MRLRGVLAIATIIAGAVVTTPVRAVTKWLCGNPGFRASRCTSPAERAPLARASRRNSIASALAVAQIGQSLLGRIRAHPHGGESQLRQAAQFPFAFVERPLEEYNPLE